MQGFVEFTSLWPNLKRASLLRRATALTLNYARVILLLFAGVTLLAAIQLPALKIDVTPRSLAATSDDSVRQQLGFRQDSGDMTLIVIEDRELFAEENLRTISGIVHTLGDLPFVTRVESLFDTPNLRVENETVYSDPFIAHIAPSPEAVERIISDARTNALVHRNLLSDDGTMMVINLHLDAAELNSDSGNRIASAIENLLNARRGTLDHVFQLGMPYIGQQTSRSIQQDLLSLIPLSLLLLFTLLTLIFRSALLALLPIITSTISIVWLLGAMAFLGIPLTIMTSMAPVLMIIIGSTEDIHLISEYLKGRGSDIGHGASIRYMVRRLRLAVVLTFVTSYLGFMTIGASPIEMLREFGWVASTGLLVNFMVTVVLLAVLIKLFGPGVFRSRIGEGRGSVLGDRFSAGLTALILKHKQKLFVLSGAVLMLSLSGGLNLEVNNNLLDYFAEDSGVKQRIHRLERHMDGTESFTIVLDGRIEGAFNHRRYLDEIKAIQSYVESSDFFDSSISLVDYLVLLNRVLNDGNGYELPRDDGVIEGLTSLVDTKALRSVVNEDFSRTAIVVRHPLAATAEVRRALSELQLYIADHIDSTLGVTFAGSTIASSEAHQLMSRGMLLSLALMLSAILVVVWLLFSSYRTGLIAVVANAFPIVMLFGLMGCLGIHIDAATSMIAVIALGVCIDHTMHFMVCYRHALKLYGNPARAVRYAMTHEMAPITTASLALCLGLGAMIFSGFEPIARFGGLSALVIAAAYFSNLVIMPALLLARVPGQRAARCIGIGPWQGYRRCEGLGKCVQRFEEKFYLTRIPGWAPSSGLRMKSAFPPGPAASTMPSEIPKRILRGARLATITVSFPSRSSGA